MVRKTSKTYIFFLSLRFMPLMIKRIGILNFIFNFNYGLQAGIGRGKRYGKVVGQGIVYRYHPGSSLACFKKISF